MTQTILRILAFMAILAVPTIALGQTPDANRKPPIRAASPAVPPAGAPLLTDGEKAALEGFQAEYAELEKQRQDIVSKEQALGQKYQNIAAALAKEHPGFVLGANNVMVPKPEEKKADEKKN
jgi:hypothetical protein